MPWGGAPESRTPAAALRQTIDRQAAKLDSDRAGQVAATTAGRAADALTATGEVDAGRYGRALRARRLVVGDPYLAKVLYGTVPQQQAVAALSARDVNVIGKGRSAWDIAREAYNKKDTVYIFPDGSQKRGHQIPDFRKVPAGTKVVVNSTDDNLPETYQTIGINGKAQDIAGDETLGSIGCGAHVELA